LTIPIVKKYYGITNIMAAHGCLQYRRDKQHNDRSTINKTRKQGMLANNNNQTGTSYCDALCRTT
tara:strand:+ start:301 stop:495 length:195 start_codon:yes stop_codon:yes gene_type:complete